MKTTSDSQHPFDSCDPYKENYISHKPNRFEKSSRRVEDGSSMKETVVD
jgi:hypothetical protein